MNVNVKLAARQIVGDVPRLTGFVNLSGADTSGRPVTYSFHGDAALHLVVIKMSRDNVFEDC